MTIPCHIYCNTLTYLWHYPSHVIDNTPVISMTTPLSYRWQYCRYVYDNTSAISMSKPLSYLWQYSCHIYNNTIDRSMTTQEHLLGFILQWKSVSFETGWCTKRVIWIFKRNLSCYVSSTVMASAVKQ